MCSNRARCCYTHKRAFAVIFEDFIKQRKKLNSAVHIKQHTRGTSNEISFSVLDAAKLKLDAQQKNSDIKEKPGSIRLFSLPTRRRPYGISRQESNWPPVRLEEQAIDTFKVEDATLLPTRRRPRGVSRQEHGRSSATLGAHSAGVSKTEKTESHQVYSSPFTLTYSAVHAAEIARRKSKRKLHKRIAAISGVCAVGVVLALGIAVGVAAFQDYRQHVTTMAETLVLIESVDETFVRLDEVLTNPLDLEYADTLESLISELQQQEVVLKSAAATISNLYDRFVLPNDTEAASSSLASIEARLVMIEAAQYVLNEALDASLAWQYAENAWTAIVEADGAAREAATCAAEGTTESITESSELSNNAIASFQSAASFLIAAMEVYAYTDLSLFQTYIDKRIEALGYAIASNNALLIEDTELATSENDSYNLADSEAAQLMQNISGAPEDKVLDDFEDRVSEYLATYENAQASAASTDAYLRSYRGN